MTTIKISQTSPRLIKATCLFDKLEREKKLALVDIIDVSERGKVKRGWGSVLPLLLALNQSLSLKMADISVPCKLPEGTQVISNPDRLTIEEVTRTRTNPN